MCTITDLFGNPFIASITDNKVKSLGGYGSGGSGDSSTTSSFPRSFGQRLKAGTAAAFEKEHLIEWAKGEFIGDWLFVPITLFIQRLAPFMMNRIRQGTKLVFGKLFRLGIDHALKRWAKTILSP